MKKFYFKYVIALLFLLLPQFILAQVIDEDSKYIIVEGDVVDSVKLQQLTNKKRDDYVISLQENSVKLSKIKQLIEIGKENGKITDEELFVQALRIYDEYLSFKKLIEVKSRDRQWNLKNKPLINATIKLQNVEGELNILANTNEQKVEKMLKKRKINKLFVPYLEALYSKTQEDSEILKNVGIELSPDEIPYKKGTKKILNPYNRNYCYVNNYSYLDSLDLKAQIKDWEWWSNEKSEKTYTAYPRSMYYYIYKSHPEYRVIQDVIFNADGNIVCQVGLIRSDRNVIDILKEELLKSIYIKDYKSNKYDILKASAKTQENVKLMLGLPYKSFVDKKTAAKNQKIIKDAFRTRAEADLKNGTYEQRAKAKRDAEKAERKFGMLLFDQLADNDFNAANNFKNQLEKDHKDDLYRIYKITRVNNTSFKVAFMNKDNKSSYTGLVTVKQTGKFQYDYEYKLIPNDQTVEVNPSDYPKIVQQESTKKRRRH